MAKNHLKRISAPKTWEIPRKSLKFIVRPKGYLKSSMPVAVILKESLKLAGTRAEAKKIVNSGSVSVDGKIAKSDRLPVGMMSVISVGGKDYRMLFNSRGKLFLKTLSSKENAIKLCRIISKTTLKGNRLQFGFHDGRTMLAEKKDFKINDTVAFKLPDFKIIDCFKLEKNAKAYLTGGSNVGRTGTIESVSGDSVIIKMGSSTVKASKENVFVIGGESEIISASD